MNALATPLPPFKSVSYAGRATGPRLIVTGAVHGNEVCGTRAIERVMAELDAGTLKLAAGRVTLVPIANAKAYVLRRRAGDRNLNRALQPSAAPVDFEDHVANWLCPLLAAHEVLLDLHSFQSEGRPFVMVGPNDNGGRLEPFVHATQEEGLVRCLGVGRAVDGWLGTYAEGVARRRALAAAEGRPPSLEQDARYGVGTTEYMRAHGGWVSSRCRRSSCTGRWWPPCRCRPPPPCTAAAAAAAARPRLHLRASRQTRPRTPRPRSAS